MNAKCQQIIYCNNYMHIMHAGAEIHLMIDMHIMGDKNNYFQIMVMKVRKTNYIDNNAIICI